MRARRTTLGIKVLLVTQGLMVLGYLAVLRQMAFFSLVKNEDSDENPFPNNNVAWRAFLDQVPLMDMEEFDPETFADDRIPAHTQVAIGLALTTVNSIVENNRTVLPFLNDLLVSFCLTASPGFIYNFYMAYDYSDPLLSRDSFRDRLSNIFHGYVKSSRSHCPLQSNYTLTYVRCPHAGRPAWAQNDAMMEAYLDGNDYFFRVNDDTILETSRWTEAFIHVLLDYNPPNVGVVGPNHYGGNMHILTYDFVHRTHVEIFGCYYPRRYKTWYADGWITNAYLPDRSHKLAPILLTHTSELGHRYSLDDIDMGGLADSVTECDPKLDVIRYISLKDKDPPLKERRKVISMVLWNTDGNLLWGAIRNAQLIRIFYHGWRLRIYIIPDSSGQTGQQRRLYDSAPGVVAGGENPSNSNHVVRRTITRLRELGADVRELAPDRLPLSIPALLWNLLVADDPDVDVFLIRKADQRLSLREAAVVNQWLSGASAVHTMRDHPAYIDTQLADGAWGARTRDFRRLISAGANMTVESLLRRYAATVSTVQHRPLDMWSFTRGFLDEVLWPLLNVSVTCHDSVQSRISETSTTTATTCARFPDLGKAERRVGTKYDRHEEPIF